MRRLTHVSGLLATCLGVLVVTACGQSGASTSGPTKPPSPAPSASLWASGPYRVDLEARTQGSCQTGSDAGSWPVMGYVSIARTADGTITAGVTMENGTPNLTYTVELVQIPNTLTPLQPRCGQVSTTLATDSTGHGTAHLSAKAAPGATGAFVHAVRGTDSSLDNIGTPNTTFR